MNYKKLLSNDLSIFILLFLIWFSLFGFTGSFNKGYNIYEDFFIITTTNQLNVDNIPTVTYNSIKQDIDVRARFRFLFDFYKVIVIKVFSDNLIIHSFFTVILRIITSFFLYKFCIETGFTILQSLLFGILIFTGSVVIAWSDISCAETLAILFLSMSLYFCAKSLNSSRRKLMYKTFFIILLVCASLTKENFILTIPAVLYLYIWLYSLKNNITFFNSAKSNYVLISVLPGIMAILLFSIYFFVGINSQGYTGVEINKLGFGTGINFVTYLFSYNIFILILGGLFIIFTFKLIYRKSKDSESGKSTDGFYFLNIFILFLLIVFPQYIIYIKAGLSGRYLLPFLMGFSLFLLFVLKYIFESKKIPIAVKYLYLVFVFIFIFFEIKNETITTLQEFTAECKSTTAIAEAIVKSKNQPLLFVFDPVQNFHEVYSFKIYLSNLSADRKYKYGFVKSSRIHSYFADYYSDSTLYRNYLGGVLEEFGEKNLLDSVKNKDDIKDIFMFNNLRNDFLEQNKYWFDESKFEKRKFGKFTLYSKY